MNQTMQAMLFDRAAPVLAPRRVPLPIPTVGQVRVKVSACGVCRTDQHVIDGELTHPKPTLIPGHEIVGRVDALGPGVVGLSVDERVGVPWLGHTCGQCRFCRSGGENLCDTPLFHGYTRDGGYAEFVIADADFCFRIPECYDDEHAAPLLCAGLIGYRTLRMASAARCIGIYGFGAAAHIVTQIAAAQGRVFAFTKAGDRAAQKLATDVGATWAGASSEQPPATLDAALIFAPDGTLVPLALAAVDKGGTVLC